MNPLAGFDPRAATTLAAPAVGEPGHWIGAPALFRYRGVLLLAMRHRTPDRRGHTLTIRRVGDDPLDPDGYEVLATIDPQDLGGVSLERAALYTLPDGRLSVLVGVDRGENDWVVRRLAAVEDPADLSADGCETVLTPRAGTSDAVSVKDPVVVWAEERYWCFYAGHDGTSEQAHVATSEDGLAFEPVDGPVLGRWGWHDHHTRVAWARQQPDANPAWTVAYGGSGAADHGATWNLRTGFASGPSPTELADDTPERPALAGGPPGAEPGETFHTCRYVDAVPVGEGWLVVAEVARADGAFELRGDVVHSRGEGGRGTV